MQNVENVVFHFVLKNKQNIIRTFQVFYVLYIVFILYGAVAIFTNSSSELFYIVNAKHLGQIALILFCMTITSGILRRFRTAMKLSSALVLIRRHLGMSTFLVAFSHYLFVRGIFNLLDLRRFLAVPPLFELFGMTTLFLMSILFFTSNEFAVRKLGRWWKRVHSLVYIMVWLIFFHTILQKVDLFSSLISLYAVLEVVSHIVNHTRLKVAKIATISQ